MTRHGPELLNTVLPNALHELRLELHDGAGALIASNDNWVRTILAGLLPQTSRDILDSGYAPTDLESRQSSRTYRRVTTPPSCAA